MTAKKKDPVLPIRPHTYLPDVSEAPDWKGKRMCAGCHLPEDNRVHDYKQPKDVVSDRIIGEGEGE